jgi:hypothetical protein
MIGVVVERGMLALLGTFSGINQCEDKIFTLKINQST